MSEVWMVRAGRGSVYIDDFLEQKLVVMGWEELGPIKASETKTQVLQRYKAVYPDHSEGKAKTSVSQALRFINEIKVGDTVITYDRDRRIYCLGEILSDAEWSPDIVSGMPRIRRVSWTHRVSRDRLSADTKNTLGAIQTLFQIKRRAAKELLDKNQGIIDSTQGKIFKGDAARLQLEVERQLQLQSRQGQSAESWENFKRMFGGSD